MREFGDWMAEKEPQGISCDARKPTHGNLDANEKVLDHDGGRPCNSLLIDFDGNEGQYLMDEISDYLELSGENPCRTTDNERAIS